MKDDERQPGRPARLSLFRSLWYRSRTEARDDAEAGRAITMPMRIGAPPLQQVLRRLAMGLLVLALTTLIVYADHDGYNDNSTAPSASSTPPTTPPSRSRPLATATSPRSATRPDSSTSSSSHHCV